MTEEQKIQAIEKATTEYRAAMLHAKREFNDKVKSIIDMARARQLQEVRQKIHGKSRKH